MYLAYFVLCFLSKGYFSTTSLICRFKLKLYATTFFYFTVNSMQLLIVLFLSFIFCLKSMVEIQVKKISSFIYIFSITILHCICDLMRNFMNYMLENVLSIKNKMIEFGIWFSDWLQFLIDMILTHVRIWKFNLKHLAKSFFYFTVNSILLFIFFVSELYFLFEINVWNSSHETFIICLHIFELYSQTL